MNIDKYVYESGLIASGCWDKFDDYDQKALEKFAELIVRDFLSICESERDGYVKLRRSAVEFEDKNIYAEGETACDLIRVMVKRHFGVE